MSAGAPAPRDASRAAGGAGPWVAFAVCCAIWGSTFLFIRISNDTLPPMWAATLRLAPSAAILALIALVLRRPWPRGAELHAALWFGAVDFGVSLPLVNWGEREVPSGTAAVMFATVPLTTALFARMFGLERLRARQVTASLAALAGVAVLAWGAGGQAAGGARWLSLLAVFLSATTAALSGVLLKRAPDSDPLAMNAVANLAGLPICLLLGALLGERPVMPRGSGLTSIAFLVVFGSITVFATFAWLLQRWSVTRTSYITVVIPVIAVWLGWAVRGERLGLTALVGSAIVIAAVVHGLRPEPARARSSL